MALNYNQYKKRNIIIKIQEYYNGKNTTNANKC